jgi:hypothetical protein
MSQSFNQRNEQTAEKTEETDEGQNWDQFIAVHWNRSGKRQ